MLACLIITSTFKDTSTECLYQGLERVKLLKDRRWHQKLCFCYKIVKLLTKQNTQQRIV